MKLNIKPTVISVIALVLVSILVIPAKADFLEASGKLTLLRVQDVGSKYGPASDVIDVEVIAWLDSKPGMAFGFQLRTDANQAARQGMLDILRDAFKNGYTVTIDFDIDPGKKNGVIKYAWITKPAVLPGKNQPVAHSPVIKQN